MWPVTLDSFEMEKYKMEILKLCRHNILNLGPLYPPASLSSMPELPFPGDFVQLQNVVTLYDDSNKELVDCRMTPIGNCQFEVNNVSEMCYSFRLTVLLTIMVIFVSN